MSLSRNCKTVDDWKTFYQKNLNICISRFQYHDNGDDVDDDTVLFRKKENHFVFYDTIFGSKQGALE